MLSNFLKTIKYHFLGSKRHRDSLSYHRTIYFNLWYRLGKKKNYFPAHCCFCAFHKAASEAEYFARESLLSMLIPKITF